MGGRKLLLAALLLAMAANACGRGTGPSPLLMLLTVDTLRSDRLGAYGSQRELTPRLDRLASESVVFERMYAPASFTVPSISTVLTGRYPEQNGIFRNESLLPGGVTTLAALLKSHGYRTGAVVSNWVLRPGGGLERGFDAYDASYPQTESTREAPERIATATTDAALETLDRLTGKRSEGVFLWVHYQDPHGPYSPPGEIRELVAERAPEGEPRGGVLPFAENNRGFGAIPKYQRMGDEARVDYYRIGYEAEIRYTDREIGRLLDGLRERGLDGSAMIVFAADHGEGLGENDYWFAHGEYLTDPLVRVPFFIRVPGRSPGRRSDPAALVDVLPTVLGLVGLEPPPDLQGRDLLREGAADGETAAYMATLHGSTVPRFGLVSRDFKYLLTVRDEETTEQLFRAGSEGEDLKERESAQLLRMRRELDEMRRQLGPIPRERLRQLRGEDRARLRALGYLHDD